MHNINHYKFIITNPLKHIHLTSNKLINQWTSPNAIRFQSILNCPRSSGSLIVSSLYISSRQDYLSIMVPPHSSVTVRQRKRNSLRSHSSFEIQAAPLSRSLSCRHAAILLFCVLRTELPSTHSSLLRSIRRNSAGVVNVLLHVAFARRLVRFMLFAHLTRRHGVGEGILPIGPLLLKLTRLC